MSFEDEKRAIAQLIEIGAPEENAIEMMIHGKLKYHADQERRTIQALAEIYGGNTASMSILNRYMGEIDDRLDRLRRLSEPAAPSVDLPSKKIECFSHLFCGSFWNVPHFERERSFRCRLYIPPHIPPHTHTMADSNVHGGTQEDNRTSEDVNDEDRGIKHEDVNDEDRGIKHEDVDEDRGIKRKPEDHTHSWLKAGFTPMRKPPPRGCFFLCDVCNSNFNPPYERLTGKIDGKTYDAHLHCAAGVAFENSSLSYNGNTCGERMRSASRC